QISAFTPAQSAGVVDVRVTNTDGNSAVLTNGYFYEGVSITAAVPGVAAFSGGTVITLSGTGFQAGAIVLFGGIAATNVTVMSSTQLTATAPAHALGIVDVQVTNSGGGTDTLPGGITFVTPPRIDRIFPDSGLNSGGTQIAITGAGYKPGVVVTFGGVAGIVTAVSDTLINVTTPVHTEGSVDVVVLNTDGGTNTVVNGFRFGKILFQNGFEAGSFAGWSSTWSPQDTTINADPAFVHSGAFSSRIFYHKCGISVPPTPLTFTQVPAGALPARTYFVQYTYNRGTGQTLASAEQQVSLAAGNLLRVNSPPAQVDIDGYHVYISTTTNTETRQDTVTIPIGTAFTEPSTGLIAGAARPTSSACGNSAQDVNLTLTQKFTANEGFPNGLEHFFVRGYFYLRPLTGGQQDNVLRKLVYLKSVAGAGGTPNFYFAMIVSRERNGQTVVAVDNFSVGGSLHGVFTGGPYITFNEYHQLEMEWKANTPGLADGRLAVWLDNQLIFESNTQDLRINRTDGISRVEIGNQEQRFSFQVLNAHRFWDDIAIADAYIGP
ncbi:MAG: IPT/TIG domain-containing protein, partial [Terriglobales bacterium]